MTFSLGRCSLCHKHASSSLGCCAVCAAELFQPRHYSKGIYLGSYDAQLKRAVRAFKFGGVTRLAGLFAKELALELGKEATTKDYRLDVLCCVPLHWTRYLQRGYNQSALIAKALAKTTNISYANSLRRTKRTQQQAKLKGFERQANVENAFTAKQVRGKRVGLVDDVITTGATIRACEEALLGAGAASVLWLSVTAYHSS